MYRYTIHFYSLRYMRVKSQVLRKEPDCVPLVKRIVIHDSQDLRIVSALIIIILWILHNFQTKHLSLFLLTLLASADAAGAAGGPLRHPRPIGEPALSRFPFISTQSVLSHARHSAADRWGCESESGYCGGG